MNKVRLIERSIRCQTLGWLAMIPVLGLIPAILTLRLGHQVRSETGAAWNPAEPELRRGLLLGWLGLALTVAALLIAVVVVVINQN